MKRSFFAAAIAALPASAIAATPFDPTALPAHFQIAHGQSLQAAMQQARFEAWTGVLRAGRATTARSASADAASSPPAILGGTIVSTTLTVGEAGSIPDVKISYKTGASGLAGVTLVFTAPDGNESLSVNYAPQGLSTHGAVEVQQPGSPPYYSQPGKWQLVSGFIVDYAGNFVSYSQTQLATLFATPYITFVNNGPVDITPPTVTSGKILTPTVSLSSPAPVFEATLTGTDDVSGLYQPYVGVEPPGSSFSQVDQAPMPFPLLNGTGTAYSTLFTSQPKGIWRIAFYAFCDVAGNCFSDTSAKDIKNLFGTTKFKVTD
jgi:hypothetical protein